MSCGFVRGRDSVRGRGPWQACISLGCQASNFGPSRHGARSVSETFALNPFLDQLMLCIAGPWKKASRHTWYRYQLLYRQQACTCGENKLAGLMRVRMHLAISK